jgi:uncharacterized membrane protein YfcA
MATLRFHRSGFTDTVLLRPLLLGSVPFAAIGGAIHLSRSIYSPLLGVILLFSAVSLLRSRSVGARASQDRVARISTLPAVAVGSGVGLLAGLTGTGGGFFLSPVLLMLGWASIRQTAALSTAFILANSLAALASNLTSVGSLPEALPMWAIAVVVGGFIGAELGSRWLSTKVLLRLLALTLMAAGLKLCFLP